MNEANEDEDSPEEIPHVEIPDSDEKNSALDFDSPKHKEALREKFGVEDPDFDVLWDLSVRDLEKISDDEDHPLHEKANRFLTIMMEPLRETMRDVLLPIFENMPKPDLSGINNVLLGLSESLGENLKPNIDFSAISNVLKGINLPRVDTSMLLPQIEAMKLIPQTDTMKLLSNYDFSSVIAGIDFSAITSAVDTSSWLNSVAPSLPKYEISAAWRDALEAASHHNDDVSSGDLEDENVSTEEFSETNQSSVISQEVVLRGSPHDLKASELAEVVATQVDGVNQTLERLLEPILQAMLQSSANTAAANAKIEEANRLSALANELSDQANKIIEEAGESSDALNLKMLRRASWSAWLAGGALCVAMISLLYTIFCSS